MTVFVNGRPVTLRTCSIINCTSCISSSGHLWPQLNHKILDVAQLRLRFCSIAATKSERNFVQLIIEQVLIPGMTVYHALVAAGLSASADEVRDRHGNPVGLGGAVTEGMELIFGNGTGVGTGFKPAPTARHDDQGTRT